jgi:tetratricopeptide (TPR) repeat protein
LISQREPGPTGAKAIDLALLQREASLKLLVLQAGEGGPTRLEAEPQAAEDLCAEVGDLPLALVLLGARQAERPDLHLCKLLQDLRGMGAEAKSLLQAHPELGAPRGVVEALMISWEPLSAEAKSLGVLLGVMAPAVIPWELVESCRMPEQRIEEGSAFGDQQVELRRAQLLDRIGDGLYRLHPLVRQFILLQNRDAGELQGRWRKQLVAAVVHECREKLAEIFTKGNVQALNSWLLPHIRQVAEKFTGDLSEDDLIIPFFALEKKFTHDAAFDESIKWLQLGLEQNEQRNGPEHHNNAIILANLGALKAGTNSLMEAEPLLRRALAICEANPAQDELTLGIILRSLSEFLVAFNHMAEAEPLIRRALEIHENNLGADNNQVAADLHSLAGLLQASARLEEAEPLMRRALAIDEENFGSNHPAVARHLTRLASLLKNMNRLEEAESLMRRALEIFEHNYDSYWPSRSST